MKATTFLLGASQHIHHNAAHSAPRSAEAVDIHSINVMSCVMLTPAAALGALAPTAATSRHRPATVRGAHHHNLNNSNLRSVVSRGGAGGGGSRFSRGSLLVRATWWENLPLPPTFKRGAKEFEYFQGSPLEQLLPWMSSPKATTPGRGSYKSFPLPVQFSFEPCSSSS